MMPLAGRRIVVTRDEAPGGRLSALLRSRSAEAILRPATEVVALLDLPGRRTLRDELPTADWLLLTSPRTVGFLDEAGWFDAPPPPGLRVGVAGARTARALESAGWAAQVIPDEAGGEPLLAALLERVEETGQVVLFPASARAGTSLPGGLREAGFQVRVVPLYEPRVRPQDPEDWTDLLDVGLDALTFTSPSAVDGLLTGLREAPGGASLAGLLRRLPAAVQGPATESAARAAGWDRVAVAVPHDFEGLVAALERLLQDPVPSPDIEHRA